MIQALKAFLFAAAACAAVAALPLSAEAAPAIPAEPHVALAMPAQYGPPPWQRCRWLRERARELEYRVAYAPPWERQRLEWRLGELRHELWAACRW